MNSSIVDNNVDEVCVSCPFNAQSDSLHECMCALSFNRHI